MTSQGTAHGRFQRAIARRDLSQAELAAYELESLSVEDALQLVELYADRRSPKFERAAIRWLLLYAGDGTRSLEDVAATACWLVERRSRR